MSIMALPKKSKERGFSYVEVLVATTVIAIALVPAINALQTGIQSTGIHQDLTVQHYQRLQKMEELQAEPYANLLAAAKIPANKTTATTYSDASGAINRIVVFMALYDADADPFTLIDPNIDADNDLYTGSTANLLWIRVETEGTAQGIETLVSR
jgi:type II secretory pathway pseudopilin PulG